MRYRPNLSAADLAETSPFPCVAANLFRFVHIILAIFFLGWPVTNSTWLYGQQLPAQYDFPSFDELMNTPKAESSAPNNSGNPSRIPQSGAETNDLSNSNGSTNSRSGQFQPPIGESFGLPFGDNNSLNLYPANSGQGITDILPPLGSETIGSPNNSVRLLPYDPVNGQLRSEMPAEDMAGNAGGRVSVVPEFDWKSQVTSVADLRFPTSESFQHGDAFLTPDEESAYMDLISAVATQRRYLLQQTLNEFESSTKQVSQWEEAFYQFANARRLAWNNGHLRHRQIPSELSSDLPDPFRQPTQRAQTLTQNADAPFVMLDDIARFPEDYVGRPVILYGRFTAGSVVRLADELRPEATFDAQYQARAARPQVQLLRGILSSIDTGHPIAEVDTQGLLTPQRGNISISDWPSSEPTIPVVVKGWVVKKWGGRPLIYCQSLRQISPNPQIAMIRNNTVDKRRLRNEEKWLYYETMKQLELNSPKLQQSIAADVLRQRIDNLMLQVQQKADININLLAEKLKSQKISESTFRTEKTSIQRQLGQRIGRYRKYRKSPEEFQTYVDMFQHPAIWHGHLVTLQGHVRHIVSYPGDETLFDGRMLRELWLFTDDSQHNPAVIVTPNLPDDFPVDADVINRVKVTGCFFKRYVYGSQDTQRIAPLVLAGHVEWEPTIDQVQTLVANGRLAAGSPRALRAASMNGSKIGNTAMILLCVFVVLVLMILWGRAQREERDRVRLRKRVNEVPEFENPNLPDYPVATSDFSSDYSRDYRLS